MWVRLMPWAKKFLLKARARHRSDLSHIHSLQFLLCFSGQVHDTVRVVAGDELVFPRTVSRVLSLVPTEVNLVWC